MIGEMKPPNTVLYSYFMQKGGDFAPPRNQGLTGVSACQLVLNVSRSFIDACTNSRDQSDRDANKSSSQDNPVYSYRTSFIFCKKFEQFHFNTLYVISALGELVKPTILVSLIEDDGVCCFEAHIVSEYLIHFEFGRD